MEITVLYTSHRVEMLRHFEEEAKKVDTIIIEEPRDENFEKMLRGDISVESYVANLDTSFPVYARYQCEILKKLYKMGKKIYQVEPYLEILEKIHKAIETGKFDEVVKDKEIAEVREVERLVNEAWIEYQEAFIKRDFDMLVNATVKFSKADAKRFKIRDLMRAKEISRVVKDKTLVEAGHIHVLLSKYLEDFGFVTKTISLLEIVAKELKTEVYLNPGNVLTMKYMLNEDVGDEEAKLLAARGIVYISLIPKKELLPSENDPYPHFVRENKVARIVNKLSYDECKDIFYKIWHRG